MEYMFDDVYNLKTIYVSDLWSTVKVTKSTYMFVCCYELVGGNGTVYSSAFGDKTYACIDTPTQKGYFTAKA